MGSAGAPARRQWRPAAGIGRGNGISLVNASLRRCVRRGAERGGRGARAPLSLSDLGMPR